MIPLTIVTLALETTKQIFTFLCTEQGQEAVKRFAEDTQPLRDGWNQLIATAGKIALPK